MRSPSFTLVKRIGVGFFFSSHFFGFTQSFPIFGYNIWSVVCEANVAYIIGVYQIHTQ